MPQMAQAMAAKCSQLNGMNDRSMSATIRPTIEMGGPRIVVFLICIAVGFAGCQFVRLLNTDPRKQVRESLASELAAENTRLESLESENMDLRKQIEAQSASATQSAAERIVKENEAAADKSKYCCHHSSFCA